MCSRSAITSTSPGLLPDILGAQNTPQKEHTVGGGKQKVPSPPLLPSPGGQEAMHMASRIRQHLHHGTRSSPPDTLQLLRSKSLALQVSIFPDYLIFGT